MQQLILMVGIPGSGKSTFVSQIAETLNNFEVVSSDVYRKIMFGSESCQENGDILFRCIHTDIETFLKDGKTVIFDATNIKYKDRKQVLDIARKVEKIYNIHIYKIAYVMHTSIEQCIINDAGRERKVTPTIIWKFAKNFNCPQYFEGFNDIKFTNFSSYNCDAFNQFNEKMEHFDQCNPHHVYELGEHCRKLAQISFNEGEDEIFTMAAKLHDVGKLDTQTFDSSGVAHYYNHENVSTLRAINFTSEAAFEINKDALLHMYFLINNHMKIRTIKTEKSIKKYKNLWGEDWFNELKRFEIYDNAACGEN